MRRINFLIVLLGTVSAEVNEMVMCSQKGTCSSCIQTPGCSWCNLPPEDSIVSRCMNDRDVLACSGTLVTPQSFISEMLSNADLTEGKDGIGAVQITPQKIRVKLRRGGEVKVPIKFKQAEDYPVDLYYLMDLSSSMKDDKDKLSKLGDLLGTTMRKMTNNFQLGFGSFVDKPAMPYINEHPKASGSNCDKCVPPYSYKNHMKLNSDSNLFAVEVSKAGLSGNMDNPESGLDGLMQVMVCTEQIGWREKSRKLIVFSTDAAYHIAGDGKLAGIVEPNDEKCHLDQWGNYTHSLQFDYPSITQIDKIARQNNMQIIFAITKENEKIYNNLRDHLHLASTGVLSQDSSNVVDLVKSEYMKIVNSVRLNDDAGGAIEIQYYTKCQDETSEKQTNECGKLKGRPLIEFTAVIRAVDCPEDKSLWKRTIEIKPNGLDEKLEIEVEISCECGCEATDQLERNSTSCSEVGDLKCGVCACNEGRYGKFCQCDGDNLQDTDHSKCRANETADVCSNNGICKCNKCDCYERHNPEEKIYGSFCECDNFSCERSGGKICSGAEQGRCECGKCVCQSGWSGEACDCRETNTTCIEPDTDAVCSNHGFCSCGVCMCDMTDKFRYSGQYCQECPHCSTDFCEKLRSCVECQIGDAEDCQLECDKYEVDIVDVLESDGEKVCKIPDNSSCTMIFDYISIDNDMYKITAQRTKECAKPVDLVAVISSVVGAVVLAGILMLVFWKVATSIHDKREYSKFEKERLMAKWDRGDNPLYKPSTSTFSNPAFGQRVSKLM